MNPNKQAIEELKQVPHLDGRPPRFAWNQNLIVMADLKPRKTQGQGERPIEMSLLNSVLDK